MVLVGLAWWRGSALWEGYTTWASAGTSRPGPANPGGISRRDALNAVEAAQDEIDSARPGPMATVPGCSSRLLAAAPPGFRRNREVAYEPTRLAQSYPGARAGCVVIFRNEREVKILAAVLIQFDNPARALADHKAQLTKAAGRGWVRVATALPGAVIYRGSADGVDVIRVYYVKGHHHGYLGLATPTMSNETDRRTVEAAARMQIAQA